MLNILWVVSGVVEYNCEDDDIKYSLEKKMGLIIFNLEVLCLFWSKAA